MIWSPTFLLSICPAGIDIAGRPAMFASTVVTSYAYISSTVIVSPILCGSFGDVGRIIASTSSNIFLNWSFMWFLAFRASR